jgi:hypothetical protein
MNELPLGDLPWESFERFCERLWSLLGEAKDVHSYGVKGAKQKGVDFIVELTDGSRLTVQCKRRRAFERRDLDKVVADHQYEEGHRKLVMVSCPAAASARDALDRNPGWELWDLRDISRKVKDLNSEAARRIVEEFFGAEWRRQFLGLQGPATFITAEEFFSELLDPQAVFSHAWELVGQVEALDRLEAFIAGDGRLALLLGPGGSGKSRLLLEAWRRDGRVGLESPIRFLAEGAVPSPEAVDELPDGRFVLVIDDAHRREGIETVLAAIRRLRPLAKLLLALRPQGLGQLNSQAALAGLSPAEATIALRPLSKDEARQLAALVLGVSSINSERLGIVSGESPLVTVVGGQLFKQGKLDPALAMSNETFRRLALDRFADVTIGRVMPQIESRFCRQLLRLVAGLQPVRMDNEALLTAMAASVDVPEHELTEALGLLTQAGILLRRGPSLRIVPDVLADHLLHESCVNASGDATGYAFELFWRFAGFSPQNLLRNLAELDWRLARSGSEGSHLLAEVWASIRDQFVAAPASTRSWILGLLADIAHYQPEPVLDLVLFAIRNEPTAPEPEGRSSWQRATQKEILERIPAVLRNLALSPDHLSSTCDLLWELGRNDDRPTNSFPNHGIRVLQELAKYEWYKPLWVNERVLDAATQWLRDASAHGYHHSPLDIVDALFETSGMSHEADGDRLVLKTYAVPVQPTAELRTRALELVKEVARSAPPRGAFRAVSSLEHASEEPIGLLNRQVSQAERESWVPYQLRAIEAMRELIGTTSSLVDYKIITTAIFRARHASSPVVRAAASELCRGHQASLEVRLIAELADYYGTAELGLGSTDQRERDTEAETGRKTLIGDLVEACKTALALEDMLITTVATMREVGLNPDAARLLDGLARSYPHLGRDLFEAIMGDSDHTLSPWSIVLIYSVRERDPLLGLELAARAVATGRPELTRGVARAYSFFGWTRDVRTGDVDLIRKLVVSSDGFTRSLALRALDQFAVSNANEAVKLALSVPVGSDRNVASELSLLFTDQDSTLATAISKMQIAELLGKFGDLADLEDYHVQHFLRWSGRSAPKAVVELLMTRIGAVKSRRQGTEAGRVPSYIPIPHAMREGALATVISTAEGVAAARRVRDTVLRKDWIWRHFGPQLFMLLTDDMKAAAGIQLLEEWLTLDDARYLKATSTILREVESSFLFEHKDFIATLLNRAAAAGAETHNSVVSDLMACAASGIRTGVPGRPMPQDETLRNEAQSAALEFSKGSPPERFYRRVAEYAHNEIERQLADDAAEFDLEPQG